MNLHLLIPALVGVVGSLPFLAYARSLGRHAVRIYAVGLGVAAAVYPLFAVFGGGSLRDLGIELGGVLVFVAFALAGLRGRPYLLAVGWALHMAWDLYLHPVDGSGYAPWWYPVACVGFDLFVAGFIAGGWAGSKASR